MCEPDPKSLFHALFISLSSFTIMCSSGARRNHTAIKVGLGVRCQARVDTFIEPVLTVLHV